MTHEGQVEAQLLWEDILAQLEGTAVDAPAKHMLAALTPVDLDEHALHLTTTYGFARAKLESYRALIEQLILDTTFTPLTFEVSVVRAGGVSTPAIPAVSPAAQAEKPAEGATSLTMSSSAVVSSVEPVISVAPVPPAPVAAATPQGEALIYDAAQKEALAGIDQVMAALNGGSTPTPAAPATQATNTSTTSGFDNQMSVEQYHAWVAATNAKEQEQQMGGVHASLGRATSITTPSIYTNPLIEPIAPGDAKLTFDTFVEGTENVLALRAAKQVANGEKCYNPLFIYGGPGLGKTHLLKAIQNYLAQNEPERTCVYRVARDFIDDYVHAMQSGDGGAGAALAKNYREIDVLIIDDIQHLKGAVQTVEFFFNVFNDLIKNDKQIVIAADVKPRDLGLEERITSRLACGFEVSVQTPEYELKRILIDTFYERMKAEGLDDYSGTLTQENLDFMLSKAGGNIRLIKAFVQQCLIHASQAQRLGGEFGNAQIAQIAQERWPVEGRIITIEEIQQVVEKNYNITHVSLVGDKRSKEFMEPRHVAIWMARELTDNTLAEIGDKFGGRSHGTIKHSIAWVETKKEDDRIFYDKLKRIREKLEEL
jgi:chromosomal replication initiator protein